MLKGRNNVTLIAISILTIILSISFGVYFAIGSYTWNVDNGAAVAGVVPSFAGVLLAAYAVFKQTETLTPQVQISDKLEVMFAMARMRLNMLQIKIMRWIEEDDYNERLKAQLAASEYEYTEDSGKPAMETDSIKMNSEIRHDEFKRRLASTIGDSDTSLIDMFVILDTVIYCIENSINQGNKDINNTSLHVLWSDLYEMLDEFKDASNYWGDDDTYRFKALYMKLTKCIELLNQYDNQGLFSSHSIQRALFGKNQKAIMDSHLKNSLEIADFFSRKKSPAKGVSAI